MNGFAVAGASGVFYRVAAGTSSNSFERVDFFGAWLPRFECVVNSGSREHTPVLLSPLMRYLAPVAGQVIVDGTVGLGGHGQALLPAISPGGTYVGLDLDEDMLGEARARLGDVDSDVVLHLKQANYADFGEVLDSLGFSVADQLLLDVGVNSAQLADAERGFSFERDGPLDMRYDRSTERQALDLVNGLGENELADIFYDYGQEGLSRKIARRICQVRRDARIRTTLVLARAVESAYEAEGKGRGGKVHPATRVFQALRIAVNGELANLERFLSQVPDRLRAGGCLAVISFHSLEDGIVKRFLREMKKAGVLEELTRRPEIADPQERRSNPRSRSAKLRVARRLE